MWAYVGRRLLLAIPTLVGASIIVFAMVHLAPGDPMSAVMPVDASQADIEAARRAYGFDQPLPVQYFRWLVRVVQGDLGKSIATRRPVLQDVYDALKNSLVLALRAKGLGRAAVFAHVVKNAAPQILTVLGLQFGFQLGGSVLVETVFSWPGTGYLMNLAIFQRDLPVLQGVILVLATFFVLLNLAVDLMQTLVDPRIARH